MYMKQSIILFLHRRIADRQKAQHRVVKIAVPLERIRDRQIHQPHHLQHPHRSHQMHRRHRRNPLRPDDGPIKTTILAEMLQQAGKKCCYRVGHDLLHNISLF